MDLQANTADDNFSSIPSMKKVWKNDEDLQSLIKVLDERASAVALNAEREFLSAYRVHMLTIQSELKDLNQQIAVAEEQLNDDGVVAKLEHEVSWFKSESSRLRISKESMTKDIKGMREKSFALREQNNFLSGQLKAVMKRNRVIESELENYFNKKNTPATHSKPSTAKSSSPTFDRIQTFTQFEKSASPQTPYRKRMKSKLLKVRKEDGLDFERSLNMSMSSSSNER
jgi:predicted  nucleic acid-binding Zn-ribbon protein